MARLSNHEDLPRCKLGVHSEGHLAMPIEFSKPIFAFLALAKCEKGELFMVVPFTVLVDK